MQQARSAVQEQPGYTPENPYLLAATDDATAVPLALSQSTVLRSGNAVAGAGLSPDAADVIPAVRNRGHDGVSPPAAPNVTPSPTARQPSPVQAGGDRSADRDGGFLAMLQSPGTPAVAHCASPAAQPGVEGRDPTLIFDDDDGEARSNAEWAERVLSMASSRRVWHPEVRLEAFRLMGDAYELRYVELR